MAWSSESQVSGKWWLFCLLSICKFGSSKNLFAASTSLSEHCFRFRRYVLLVQTKKVISVTYYSSTSSWVCLHIYKEGYINSYLNLLTKFTNSSRSTKVKYIFPWNLSQMITKTIPISTRIIISYGKWKLRQQHQNFSMKEKSS